METIQMGIGAIEEALSNRATRNAAHQAQMRLDEGLKTLGILGIKPEKKDCPSYRIEHFAITVLDSPGAQGALSRARQAIIQVFVSSEKSRVMWEDIYIAWNATGPEIVKFLNGQE